MKEREKTKKEPKNMQIGGPPTTYPNISYNSQGNATFEFEGEDLRKKIRALLKSFYGYTDDNNPFGDPELSKPFVWNKKVQRLRSKGMEPFLDGQTLLYKLKGAKTEIDNIIKSRQRREEMKEALEAEKIRNYEESKKLDEWREKDEKFHLAQENLRTEIRITQGREKPIDFINKVLMIWKGFAQPPVDFYEIPEYQRPYKLYEILDADSITELYKELKTRLQIDIERTVNKSFVCFYIDIASNFKKQHDISEYDLKDFIEYWKAMIVIIESYIYPEKSIKILPPEQLEQINLILENKSLSELDELEELMKKNLEEQISLADIQFWKNAISALQIARCKIILDNLYNQFNNSDYAKMLVDGVDLKVKNTTPLANQIVSKQNVLPLPEEINLNNQTAYIKINNQNIQNSFLAKKWMEEGNLSPPMYESDEELRKVALCEHDYLIKLSETRKILLAHQLSKWQKNYEASVKYNEKMEQVENSAKGSIVKRFQQQKYPINYRSMNYSMEKDRSVFSELGKNYTENDGNLEMMVNSETQNVQSSAKNISTSEEFQNLKKMKLAETQTAQNLVEENAGELNSDEEAERFLNKIKKKDTSTKSKPQTSNISQLVPHSLPTAKTNNQTQEELLLFGTASYQTNTLKASRFYLKDDAMYDSNLNHEMMQIEAQELGDGETIFNDVVPISNSNYMWASKYKPRKPRYFNRVKTGYEWNKYNQVHYDYENPPPKVIQGYKFNIFYPDLIDKTKAPQYILERSDTMDTCIIRFHAGPPYEDIAFKIVNREWDMTERAGFRNVFDRGILYLYFNFKRYRYKR